MRHSTVTNITVQDLSTLKMVKVGTSYKPECPSFSLNNVARSLKERT